MANTSEQERGARRDRVAEQVFRSVIGAQETIHIYLGHRLGLYSALADAGALTATELARAAGIAARYAREWLEQQAVSGLLDVVEDTEDPATRRFALHPAAADVLADADSLYYLAPLAPLVMGVAQALPQVVDAFRTGGGVPYAAYGRDLRDGIADANRPMFLAQLAREWIPALPDIEARLRRSDPPGHVADLGCGTGWSSIALAMGFPSAVVQGLDLDPASIEEARRNAERSGVAERVRFDRGDASDARLAGQFDLVTLFETLHDMARPVEALAAARRMLSPGGAVLIGDERVAERFTAPGDDLERFNYGWSAPHCLAAALVEEGSAGTGTVIRPDTVRRYAREAGFRAVTVLPIEHDFWRFYRLDP